MEKSLGKKPGGVRFGEQLVLSGVKTFVYTGLCVGENLAPRVGGKAEYRHSFLPPRPHPYCSFFPHPEKRQPGLSLSLPTL